MSPLMRTKSARILVKRKKSWFGVSQNSILSRVFLSIVSIFILHDFWLFFDGLRWRMATEILDEEREKSYRHSDVF